MRYHTPAFEQPYANAPASGCLAPIDAIVMRLAPFAQPWSSIAATHACNDFSVPVRFTSSTVCQSSTSRFTNALAGSRPACARIDFSASSRSPDT